MKYHYKHIIAQNNHNDKTYFEIYLFFLCKIDFTRLIINVAESHISLINVFLRDVGIFKLKLKALGIGNFNDDLTSALENHILVSIVRA